MIAAIFMPCHAIRAYSVDDTLLNGGKIVCLHNQTTKNESGKLY